VRGILLNTTRFELAALDALVDSKSKKPIKVEKELLRRLLADHRLMFDALRGVVPITEPAD
jgi:hypothetical protein